MEVIAIFDTFSDLQWSLSNPWIAKRELRRSNETTETFLSLLIAKPVSFHSCERSSLQICYLALPSLNLYANEYSFKSKDMNRYLLLLLLLLLLLRWMSDVTNGE